MRRLVARSGEPVIRQAVTQAMRILGRQFVMGRTIEEALDRARAQEKRGYRYSYDMLGESARTARDAERYDRAYRAAIAAIGRASAGRGPIEGPGISVKLSALHPRYEFAQRHRVMAELVPRLAALARLAKAADIGFTIDAEEADRLDLSLDVIEAVSADPSLAGWNGLGLAIQGYQKRVLPLIDWLGEIAHRHGRRLMVRLVKGAYWDSEIKQSQERGLRRLSRLHPQGRRPTSPSWRRPSGCSPMPRPSIRNSPPTMPIPWRPFSRWRATGAISSSSACMAWARRSTIRSWHRMPAAIPAASMRPAAAMRICWPIWCAGCWRTAPIPPSSIASSTRSCRSRRSSPILSPGSAGCRRSPIRAFPCPRPCSARSGAIPAAST